MRAAPATAIVVILVGLLSWFSLRAFDPEAEVFDRVMAQLDRFGMYENALYRDVFTARARMLRNDDPLVNEINALRASLAKSSRTQRVALPEGYLDAREDDTPPEECGADLEAALQSG